MFALRHDVDNYKIWIDLLLCLAPPLYVCLIHGDAKLKPFGVAWY